MKQKNLLKIYREFVDTDSSNWGSMSPQLPYIDQATKIPDNTGTVPRPTYNHIVGL